MGVCELSNSPNERGRFAHRRTCCGGLRGSTFGDLEVPAGGEFAEALLSASGGGRAGQVPKGAERCRE